MNKGSLLGLASLIATIALVSTGCGGGSSSRNQAYAASKADFAAAMNSLCRRANASGRALGSAESMSEVASVGPGYAAAANNLVDQLKKLEPPAEIKTQVDDYVAKAEQIIDLLNKLISAAKDNDSEEFAKISGSAGAEYSTALTAMDSDAEAIGAPACTSEGA